MFDHVWPWLRLLLAKLQFSAYPITRVVMIPKALRCCRMRFSVCAMKLITSSHCRWGGLCRPRSLGDCPRSCLLPVQLWNSVITCLQSRAQIYVYQSGACCAKAFHFGSRKCQTRCNPPGLSFFNPLPQTVKCSEILGFTNSFIWVDD